MVTGPVTVTVRQVGPETTLVTESESVGSTKLEKSDKIDQGGVRWINGYHR